MGGWLSKKEFETPLKTNQELQNLQRFLENYIEIHKNEIRNFFSEN